MLVVVELLLEGGDRLSLLLDGSFARRRSLSTRWPVGRRLSLSPRGRLVLPLATEELVNRDGIVTVEHGTEG